MRFFSDRELLGRYRALFRERFRWKAWEDLIEKKGVTLDRPKGTSHPDYPHIVYPMDYGYIDATRSSDGEAVDVFCGSGGGGLVGALLTLGYAQQKCEVKFLYDCSPEEVYLANGFLNYDRTLLEAVLVMRWRMAALRARLAKDA